MELVRVKNDIKISNQENIEFKEKESESESEFNGDNCIFDFNTQTDDFLKEIKSGEVMVEILSIEYSYTVDKLLALCKRKDNGEYLSLPLYDITLVSLKPTEINRAEFPKEITSNKTLESENPTEKALYLMNIFIIL